MARENAIPSQSEVSNWKMTTPNRARARGETHLLDYCFDRSSDELTERGKIVSAVSPECTYKKREIAECPGRYFFFPSATNESNVVGATIKGVEFLSRARARLSQSVWPACDGDARRDNERIYVRTRAVYRGVYARAIAEPGTRRRPSRFWTKWVVLLRRTVGARGRRPPARLAVCLLSFSIRRPPLHFRVNRFPRVAPRRWSS